MKKAKRTLMALLMTAAMTISSIPVTASAQVEPEPIEYVDENNFSHTLVTKYTDDMEITQLIEKIGEISPVLGLKAEYAGVFKGVLEDKIPFRLTNDFISLEDDTIYLTDMLIYNAKDENGNKAYAVKFPQSTELYLYKLIDNSEYIKGIFRDENNVKHEVTRIPTDTLDLSEEELIEMNRVLNFNGSLIEYQGKFSDPLDKNVCYTNNMNYDYHGEIEVIYSTSMIVYYVRDNNGEKAYAVKFRQLPDLYLYTVKEIDEKNGLCWKAPLIIPEDSGSPVNYWKNKNADIVSLDNADIDEINEKIGDLIPFAISNEEGVFPSDKYTFAGKFDKEVDFETGSLDGFLFINYRYDEETNTIYSVKMVIRMIQLENGEEAFLMRKEKDTNGDWYLYKLSEKAVTPHDELVEETLDNLRFYLLVDDGTGKYVSMNKGKRYQPALSANTETDVTPVDTRLPATTKAIATTTVTSAYNGDPTTIPAAEDPLQKAEKAEVTVTEVKEQTLLVRSNSDNVLLTVPAKYLDSNVKPYEGMNLIVTYDHGIVETWPAQFGNILKVTVVEDEDPFQKVAEAEVTVAEVKEQTLLVRSNSIGLLTVPAKYLGSNVKPYAGMKLIVTFNHGIAESWPAQFGNILKVTVVEDDDPLQKAEEAVVTVTEVKDNNLLVRSDKDNTLFTIPVKYLDTYYVHYNTVKPYAGMKLIVTYNHGIAETMPAQFGNILNVTAAPVKGDANCSGAVEMSDAVLIMQTLANPSKYKLTDQGKANADMDGDGITSGDALAIQKQLLNIK